MPDLPIQTIPPGQVTPVLTVPVPGRPKPPARRPLKPSGFATIIVPASTNPNFPSSVRLIEEGDRFNILSTNVPVKIQPMPAGRAEVYYAGMTGNFSEPFSFLIITNTSATTQLVLRIWIGYEELANYQPPQLPATSFDVLTTITTTGVPQPISTTDQYFSSGYFYGYKQAPAAGNIVNNTNTILVGRTAANQPDQIPSGLVIPYAPPANRLLNLATIYVVGTAGDSIFCNCSI